MIGDTGTSGAAQYRVAARLTASHAKFPFEFVIMAGDNLYGSEGARDDETKFAIPYKALLDAGVKFYASLGNHDDANQIFDEGYHFMLVEIADDEMHCQAIFGRRQDRGFRHDPAATATGAEHGPGGAVERR